MVTTNPVRPVSYVDPTDPAKTVTVLHGGETVDENKGPNLEVKAETSSVEGDPTRTETVLNAPDKPEPEVEKESEGKPVFTIMVSGLFEGIVEVEQGSGDTLKDALATIESEAGSYGNFKYRDEENKPVALTHVITEDMNLTSLERGS